MKLTDIMARIASNGQRLDDIAQAIHQTPSPSVCTTRFDGITSPADLGKASLAHVCQSATNLLGTIAKTQAMPREEAVTPPTTPSSLNSDVVDVVAREI